jgi:hypothetical protein
MNVGSYWDNSIAVFEDRLYVGTVKDWTVEPTGGEIWLYLPHTNYLPLIMK